MTTALTGDGVPALLAALERHRASGGDGASSPSRRARAAAQVRAVLVERLWDRLEAPSLHDGTEAAIEAVAGHEIDPYAAADELLAAIAGEDRS